MLSVILELILEPNKGSAWHDPLFKDWGQRSRRGGTKSSGNRLYNLGEGH